MDSLKILMLEDSSIDAYLIENSLRKDNLLYDLIRVDKKEDFTKQLFDFQPDIVLSDHVLPQFNSYEALKISKQIKPDLPFVLITGAISDETAVEILKQGADDYILKSNLTRLPSAIMQTLKHYNLKEKKESAEKALSIQKHELRKITNELDNLVYSTSHDIRSPLSTIIGLINLAFLKKEDSAAVETCLNKMLFSVNKLDRILIELMHMSYNAKLPVKSERVNIETLIQECIESLEENENKVSFTKKIRIEKHRELFTDEYRLQIMVLAILGNSLVFYDDKKNENIIEVEGTISDNLILTIKDNGIGIYSKSIPKVFEMFYRGSERSQGAGLGLYIANEAVLKLNGSLSVKSQVGKNTTFTLTVPNRNRIDA